MNSDETWALWEQCQASEDPKKVWNAWANDLLARREALEAAGEWEDKATVDFSTRTFDKGANFSGFIFPGDASFHEATFTGYAAFSNAKFTGGAYFRDATFEKGAAFFGATFTGDTKFSRATFNSVVDFENTTFTGDTKFSHATFTEGVIFDGSTFTRDTTFFGATFTGYAFFPLKSLGSAPLSSTSLLKRLFPLMALRSKARLLFTE